MISRLNKTLKIAAALCILFYAFLATARAAANTTATWTNATGNNAWEVAGNWDINQVPNSSAYDVRISTALPVTCPVSSKSVP